MASSSGYTTCSVEVRLLNDEDALSSAFVVEENLKIVLIFLMVFLLVWLCLCLGVFVNYKNSFARTKVRVTTFVSCYFLAIVFYTISNLLPLIVGVENFPCWLIFTCSTLSLAFFTSMNFTRNACFMLMTRLSAATFEYGRIPVNIAAEAEQKHAARPLERLGLLYFALRFVLKPHSVNSQLSQEDHLKTLMTLRFITSTQGSVLFAFLCTVPYLVAIIVICLSVPTFRAGCTGCLPDNIVTDYAVVGLACALVINALFFSFKVRNLPDTWGIAREGRLSARGIIIAFIATLFLSFGSFKGKYYLNVMITFGYAMGFFAVSGYQVYAGLRTEQKLHHMASPNNKSSSPRATVSVRKKHKTNNTGRISVSGSVIAASESSSISQYADHIVLSRACPIADMKGFPRLEEILSSPQLTRAFEYHLSIEFGGENLCFLQDVADWKVSYNDIAKNASAARAKKLVNSYISTSGLYQINIPYEMAEKLTKLTRNANSAEEGTSAVVVPLTAFDDARYEVANLLERGAVLRFSKTVEFTNFASGEAVVQAVT